MILKIGTSRILFMTVYAPQQGRNDEEKDRFYEQLQEEIEKLRQNEEVIVISDLNGHVGQRTDRTSRNRTKKYRRGENPKYLQ